MTTMDAVELITKSCRFIQDGLKVWPIDRIIIMCSKRHDSKFYEECRECSTGEKIFDDFQHKPEPPKLWIGQAASKTTPRVAKGCSLYSWQYGGQKPRSKTPASTQQAFSNEELRIHENLSENQVAEILHDFGVWSANNET